MALKQFFFFPFGVFRQHSQSRENINFPEDEVVGGSEGGREDTGGSASPGKINLDQTHIQTSSWSIHVRVTTLILTSIIKYGLI